MKPKTTLYIDTKQTIAGCALAIAMMSLTASAATLYSTIEDFAQFDGGAGVTSTTYFSVSSTVNGIGNQADAGGAGTAGSLQLIAGGGWTQAPNSGFPGQTAASFDALFPTSHRPYSAESGYGEGTMVATSGTLTFDIYTGDLTSWSQFGVTLNYSNNYQEDLWSSSTDFTGEDGRTWKHVIVPYTTNSTSLTYFGMNIKENSDGAIAGQTFYIDNIQVIPEPTTAASLLGGFGMLLLRRRRGTC